MDYKFNSQSDRIIRTSLQSLNNDFYYGSSVIDINTEGLTMRNSDYCQTYMVFITFQLQKVFFSFCVKSDGSGNLDFITISDNYSIDVMINKVQESKSFWGIPINHVEVEIDRVYNDKSYKLYVL